jgi:MinD-like ATPase involved in chromosome partitioning or flagellar assembly
MTQSNSDDTPTWSWEPLPKDPELADERPEAELGPQSAPEPALEPARVDFASDATAALSARRSDAIAPTSNAPTSTAPTSTGVSSTGPLPGQLSFGSAQEAEAGDYAAGSHRQGDQVEPYNPPWEQRSYGSQQWTDPEPPAPTAPSVGASEPAEAYPATHFQPTGYPSEGYQLPTGYAREQYPPQGWPADSYPPAGPSAAARPPASTAASTQPAPNPTFTPTPRPEELLLPDRPPLSAGPATWGWRGRINRLSGGLIKSQAAPDELADRKARIDIQRTFSRPMTIVVIQPKGGAGKTPTTIGLASALGAHRGGYVVGWDDNETRGTLAVRVTNSDGQKTTVWDLLGALPMFERADARVGDLSHFVRSQGEAQFDALVSDDSPGNMAQIGEDEFHRLHSVLQRFYRQIVIDTGNNVRSPNWQAAVNAADLVVVVSTYQRDVGYSGSWVLDHLTETGREQLANSAVTVLTAADPSTDPTVRRELLEHFSARTQAVVEIPYDPLIAVGGPMEWARLSPQTRQAWTRAGAAVVTALADHDERERLAARNR